MQPVKRGKRRRRVMPYLSASGCTVNSCMTVIGNPMERYKNNQTGAVRMVSTTVSLEVGAGVDFFCLQAEKASFLRNKHCICLQRCKALLRRRNDLRSKYMSKAQPYEWLSLRNLSALESNKTQANVKERRN